MSVCGLPQPDSTDPRADVNRSALPSGVKDGWLSYPGLFEMFDGFPTAHLPPALERSARKTSVAGGPAGVCDGAGDCKIQQKSVERTARNVVMGRDYIPGGIQLSPRPGKPKLRACGLCSYSRF